MTNVQESIQSAIITGLGFIGAEGVEFPDPQPNQVYFKLKDVNYRLQFDPVGVTHPAFLALVGKLTTDAEGDEDTIKVSMAVFMALLPMIEELDPHATYRIFTSDGEGDDKINITGPLIVDDADGPIIAFESEEFGISMYANWSTPAPGLKGIYFEINDGMLGPFATYLWPNA